MNASSIVAGPERSAARPRWWLAPYLIVFFGVFLTHFDIFAAERGIIPVNILFLFIAACAAFIVLAAVSDGLVSMTDRFCADTLANIVPIAFLLLWVVGHVYFVAATPIHRPGIDFAQIFPVYQLMVLLFGMALSGTRGFPGAFSLAGKVAVLILGASVIGENLALFGPEAASGRTGGFAQNANVASFNMIALLAMTLDYRRLRLSDVAVLMFVSVAVFSTLSRSGLAQLLLVSVVFLYCHGSRGLAQGRLAPLLGVLITLTGAFGMLLVAGNRLWDTRAVENAELGDRFEQLVFRGAVAEDPYRGPLYRHYLGLVYERPFLGHGTGYTLNTAVLDAPLGVGPHSMYVRTWVDNGLWGLVTYTGFILAFLGTMLRRNYTGGVLLGVMVAAYGFFSHNLIDNKTCLILLGVALGLSSPDRPGSPAR